MLPSGVSAGFQPFQQSQLPIVNSVNGASSQPISMHPHQATNVPQSSSQLALVPFQPLPPGHSFDPLQTGVSRPSKRRRQLQPSPTALSFSPSKIASYPQSQTASFSTEQDNWKEDQLEHLVKREQKLWHELRKVRRALTSAGVSLPSPSSEAVEVSRSVLRTVPSDLKEQSSQKGESDKLAVDTAPIHCDLWQFQSSNRDQNGNLVVDWEIYPSETQADMNKYKQQGCPKGAYVSRCTFNGETFPHQIARINQENLRNIENPFYESGELIQSSGKYEYFEISIKERIVRPVKYARKTFDFSRPSFWDHEHLEPRRISLPVGHPQHTEVAALFDKQLKGWDVGYNLAKVDSLQCDHRWEAYLLKKRQFLRDLGPVKLNERMLWHGTEQSNIAKIARGGFLRQFCTTHRYGKGMYFARDPIYSLHERYATPNVRGEQFLFLCKVLVGEYHEGTPNMKRPNAKNFDATYQAYESTVDNVDDPSVFVTYQDDQAYPMYVLTVTKTL